MYFEKSEPVLVYADLSEGSQQALTNYCSMFSTYYSILLKEVLLPPIILKFG